MDCSANGGLGSLATNAQKWSLTDIDYTATTSIALTASDTKTNRNIRLRTDDQNESSKNLYWNIAIPQSGVKGLCTGANTILITARGPELDTWENTGVVLPGNLGISQTVTIGDYVYLFGGRSEGNNSIGVIYRASTSDPTAWVDTGTSLPGGLNASQAVVIDEYVYLFGGFSSLATHNAIYRAPISNPTSWVDTGATLPSNLYASQAVIIDDYVYLFGGNSGGWTNIIYRAPISNPTSWVDTGTTLPGNLAYSQTATIDDYVYLFGGLTSGGIQTNVIYRAPVTNPTAWVDTGAVLPVNLHASQIATVGDYIYLLGGYSGDAEDATNAVHRAPISNPTAWVNTNAPLPGKLSHSQTAIIGDYVYLFGGWDGALYTNVIHRALIE